MKKIKARHSGGSRNPWIGKAGQWVPARGFALAGMTIFILFLLSLPALAADKESAYDRVMRTNTLRCGYGMEKPYNYKDLETGEMKGIFTDYVEALGESLSLKIEWAEEMGWGQMPTALDTGRVDAFCAVTWKTPARSRVIDYVTPITYQPMMVIARSDDHRFDGNPDALNNPEIRFTGVEGQLEIQVAHSLFPKAAMGGLPEVTGDFSQALMEIVTGKADAALTTSLTYAKFDEANPGKLAPVKNIPPVQVAGESIAVKGGEDRLRRMLENATLVLLADGTIDRIVSRYDLPKGVFFIPQPAYRDPR